MSDPVGGLLDRLIEESCFRMLDDSLYALGWYDVGPPDVDPPIVLVADPIDRQTEIPFNTMALSFEHVTPGPLELGSNAKELTVDVFVDFYAQDDSLGKHVIGDVRSIFDGELPDIGRSWPVLQVKNWSQATPTVLFACEFEQVESDKVHRPAQPWLANWYTMTAQLVHARP